MKRLTSVLIRTAAICLIVAGDFAIAMPGLAEKQAVCNRFDIAPDLQKDEAPHVVETHVIKFLKW